MGRLDFDNVDEFIRYMQRFPKRMFLYITTIDKGAVLRPAVATRIDSAVIRGLSDDDLKRIKESFNDAELTFTVTRFHWKEDIGEREEFFR